MLIAQSHWWEDPSSVLNGSLSPQETLEVVVEAWRRGWWRQIRLYRPDGTEGIYVVAAPRIRAFRAVTIKVHKP